METIDTYQQYSMESEQSVIGGLLIDSHKLPEVIEILTADDFYLVSHKSIFRAIEVLHEKSQPVDVTMVISELSSQQSLEDAGGLSYLAELAQNTPSSLNVCSYAQRVVEKRKERECLSIASQMVEAIRSDDGTSEEKINNALSFVTNFDHEDKKELTYNQQNTAFIDELTRRHNIGGGLTGVATGFNDIDERLNGLQKSDLLIVAGRPGSGKTTYAINIAKKVAEKKHVLVFSLEMSAVQLIEKIYSSNGVRMGSLKTGNMGDDEWGMIRDIAYRAKQLNITIDDRGALKPQQVRAKALRLQRKHGEIGLIVVDYLQLMTTNNKDEKVASITKISGALKALAKELNCPVMALSQLNRGVESRPNKRPLMSDLRDSGAIEQDADIIQFIYREDYYAAQEGRESQQPNIAEINTSKFRGGEVGVDYLKTELDYSRFVNLIEPYSPPEPETNKKKKDEFQY